MLTTLNNFLSTFIEPARVDSHPEHTLQLATAVLLIEVMKSDSSCADIEQETILKILKQRFLLTDAQVAQLTERGQKTANAANDLYQFTSLINRELGRAERIRILEYMWQVAYADHKISAHENHLMRKMGDLLHISHADYVAAKMRAKPADMP